MHCDELDYLASLVNCKVSCNRFLLFFPFKRFLKLENLFNFSSALCRKCSVGKRLDPWNRTFEILMVVLKTVKIEKTKTEVEHPKGSFIYCNTF